MAKSGKSGVPAILYAGTAGTSFFRGQLQGIFVLTERRRRGNCSRFRTTFRLFAAETEMNCPLEAMGRASARSTTNDGVT